MIGKGGYNGGQYAKGGTICVRDAGYRLGNGAANCTIVFEKSGDLLGSNLLGTEAVFLGINHINTDDVVIGGDLGKIYGLTGGHFQTPTGRKVKLIDNRETLTDFHQSGIGVFLVRLNTGQALLPMENKINQGDLTDGMKGGILIIEGLPDRIIGVGMKGGAVIFKNFGGDVDALKKLIFLRKSSGLLSGDG